MNHVGTINVHNWRLANQDRGYFRDWTASLNWEKIELRSLLKTTQCEACCSLTCNSRDCLIFEISESVYMTRWHYQRCLMLKKGRQGARATRLQTQQGLWEKKCGCYVKMPTKKGDFISLALCDLQLIVLNAKDLTSSLQTH